jgi:hypothetical protein
MNVVVGEEAFALPELDQLLFGFAVGLGASRWWSRRATLFVILIVILIARGCFRS